MSAGLSCRSTGLICARCSGTGLTGCGLGRSGFGCSGLGASGGVCSGGPAGGSSSDMVSPPVPPPPPPPISPRSTKLSPGGSVGSSGGLIEVSSQNSRAWTAITNKSAAGDKRRFSFCMIGRHISANYFCLQGVFVRLCERLMFSGKEWFGLYRFEGYLKAGWHFQVAFHAAGLVWAGVVILV